MKYILFSVVTILAGVAWALYLRREPEGKPVDERPLSWLLLTVPFAVGGFYTYLAPPICAYLLWFLYRAVKARKHLRVCLTDGVLAAVLLFVFYSLSFLWAADKGRAVFGYLRGLPILLYVLALLQLDKTQLRRVLRPLPLAAAAMTVVSGILQYIPGVSDAVTVAGRLAGFFEYPNTFAAFLLVSLILLDTDETPFRGRWVMSAVLMLGVFMSGSRTSFVLLLVTVAALLLMDRKREHLIPMGIILVGCVAVSLLLDRFSATEAAGRYLTTSASANTFLGRLLYFKDALPVILRHPLGLGYWGYASTQGSFQTGIYSVAFVHNGLLQLLLDVGWLPVAALVVAVCRTVFAKTVPAGNRLALLAFLAHCMFDFDLEYLAMWFVVLPLLELHGEKPEKLRLNGRAAVGVSAVLMAAALWLGLGEGLYYTGHTAGCLAVTPFHTGAISVELSKTDDPAVLRVLGEKMIRLCPKASIGHSAAANAAYSEGDMETVITECRLAVDCARYTPSVYDDYCGKLLYAYSVYAAAGDTESTSLCLAELQSLSDQLTESRETADKLAWRIEDEGQMYFSESYRAALEQLGIVQ